MEWRYAYGNISSISKILGCQRMGSPLTVGSWQLKRFNLRYSSFKSNSEGSFRLLCGDCQHFQVLAVKPSPYLTSQGCSLCIAKLPLVDTTMCVSIINPSLTNIYLTINFFRNRSKLMANFCPNLAWPSPFKKDIRTKCPKWLMFCTLCLPDFGMRNSLWAK